MLTGSLSPGTSERDAGSVMSLSRFQILIHSSLDTCSTFLSPSFSCSCTAVKNRIADKLPGKSRQKLCMIFFKLTLRWFSKFVPVMCDGSRRVFKLAFIITAKKKTIFLHWSEVSWKSHLKQLLERSSTSWCLNRMYLFGTWPQRGQKERSLEHQNMLPGVAHLWPCN